MEGIQVSVEKTGPQQNISVIKVGGYIDTTTSAELEHSLSSTLKLNNHNIIIDLGNVDYISSAGWGIFISEIKGIREKGGDLKLVRMIPEVFEVFELLEFHYILKAFDTVEEAISDFDQLAPKSTTLQAPEKPESSHESAAQTVSYSEPDVLEVNPGVDSGRNLGSIEEKLRQIIIEKPDSGTFQIIKTLNTPRYGNLKFGYFKVRQHLKQLNLDSKKKRVSFFKQQTFG